jgi:hypothetical protein
MRAILPPSTRMTDIEMRLGDFFDTRVADWSDADVVFANSTCFDEEAMFKLAVMADRCRVGAFFITFTRKLPSRKWKVLEAEITMQSWGGATTYIHRKDF